MDTLIRRITLVVMCALLFLGPAAGVLLAAPKLQADADPALAEAVMRGVAATSHLVRPSAAPGIAGDLGALTEGLRPRMPVETPLPEEEPTPEPQEEATPAPDKAPVIDLSERVEYSGGGITLQAPAGWDVLEGEFGNLFDMSVPDTEFAGLIMDAGGDMPGLLMVVFFATLPDLLIGEYMDDAEITAVELGQTAQQLPMATVLFDATVEGVSGSGAVYVISPGETVYMFFAFAPESEWQTLAPGVQLVAESITVDEELLTLVTGESGGVVFSDDNGVLELTIPEGWHAAAASTSDDTLSVLATDPDYRFAVALGSDTDFDADLSAEADGLLDLESGEVDAETQALIFDLLVEVMSEDSDFTVDESLNAVYPREGAITFRVAGEGDLGGIYLPVTLYMDLRIDGGIIGIVFGDVDYAISLESDLLEMISSAELLE